MFLQQHVISHHAYTNHSELDNDTYASEPYIIVHPASKKKQWYHIYQHIFYFFVFLLYTLNVGLRLDKIWRMKHFLKLKSNQYSLNARSISFLFKTIYYTRLMVMKYFFCQDITAGEFLFYIILFTFIILFYI
jgi:hypothetical protein